MTSKDLLTTPSIKGIKAATTGAIPLGCPIMGVQQPQVVSRSWLGVTFDLNSAMRSYGGFANEGNQTWSTSIGDYVEWKISHPGAPLGDMYLQFTALNGPNLGKFTMTMDGANPVTYDLYNVGYSIFRLVYNVPPININAHKEPAIHTFRATLEAKNPAAAANWIVLFYSLQLFAYGTPTV